MTQTPVPWGTSSYERLAGDVAVIKGVAPEPDQALRAFVESVLYREARLLDNSDFDEWLENMTPDCLYWVPAHHEGGEPESEVSLAFDDHRRLTDRVYWLNTGLVFAQIPASRTRRVISNVEAWQGDEPGLVYARSNFHLHEFRAGRQRLLSGWYGHVLENCTSREVYQARIRTKIVFLTDSDQGHDNLTILF